METNKPTVDLRICDYLQLHAEQFGDRIALRTLESSMSYGQLSGQVERCARALHVMGLKEGDRIAVLAPPRMEAFVTFLAAAKDRKSVV